MTIDLQFIANLAAIVVFGVIGYFYRQLVNDIQKLSSTINDMKVDMPTNYVRKDELSTHMVRIENMLNKIFDKLDNKVDK